MLHTVAFGQSVSANGALTQINAIQDPSFTTSGGDLRVPTWGPNVVAVAILSNDASAARAQLQSPSLRAVMNLDIEPIVAAATFPSPMQWYNFFDSPVPLLVNESLNLFVQNAQAAAVQHYGAIWLADGPVKMVTGPFYTVRATATVAQAANSWVNGALTFSQALPYGRYQVVGMRCRSADAVLARLVFPGAYNRPGVPVVTAIGNLDMDYFRKGRAGVFGEFDSTVPPTVDMLGGVAAAQTFIFDLLKVK